MFGMYLDCVIMLVNINRQFDMLISYSSTHLRNEYNRFQYVYGGIFVMKADVRHRELADWL